MEIKQGGVGPKISGRLLVKSVVADSSSIILLQKTGLLQIFLSNYSVVIAESVFRELTSTEKKGAVELVRLLSGKVVQPLRNDRAYPPMDVGERDTIELYKEGRGDFVFTDDKKAAKYCKNFSVPFINSLLVPRILCVVELLSMDEYLQKFEELISVGYYSEKIVRRAKSIDDEQLEEFFP